MTTTEKCWFCGDPAVYLERHFTLRDVAVYSAKQAQRLSGDPDPLAMKLAAEPPVFQSLDKTEADREFVIRATCDTGICYRQADDELRSSIDARSHGWTNRETGTVLFYGLLELRGEQRNEAFSGMSGPHLAPFCCLCQAPLPREGACPEHPMGGHCARIYEPVSREMVTIENDEPCLACGLPVPLKPEMFTCSKHAAGGWCFSAQDIERNAARKKQLEVNRAALIARWPNP